MKLLIDKNKLGYCHDILLEKNSISANTWSTNNKSFRNFEELLKLLCIDCHRAPVDQFSDFINIVNLVDSSSLYKLISKHHIKNYLSKVDTVLEACSKKIGKYEDELFYKRKKITEGCSKFNINGIVSKTTYNNTGTRTGRLTVNEGFNWLISKEEERKNVKSMFLGGKIVEFDIKSAEPNIYFNYFLDLNVDDPYEYLGNKCNLTLSRSDVKLLTIMTLYKKRDTSENNLKRRFKLTNKDIKAVKKFLMIDKAYDLDLSSNLYGRKLPDNNSKINYFLQSSAVDLSIFVFDKIIKKLPSSKIIGIIHDAVIIDLHPNDFKSAELIESVTEELSNIRVSLKKKYY